MANRRFGKVADVWRHLPLGEILRVEQPTVYGETHAGSAGYSPVDDPERRFGIWRFLEVATTAPVLADSGYHGHLANLKQRKPRDPPCPSVGQVRRDPTPAREDRQVPRQ